MCGKQLIDPRLQPLAGVTELVEWLRTERLESYAEALIDAGFDTVEDLHVSGVSSHIKRGEPRRHLDLRRAAARRRRGP